MRRWLFSLCVCALFAAAADARVYQWTNPATGTRQLSGTPPAWYRASAGGPRIHVYENNRLVDDTGVAVPEARRAALRAQAFGEAPPAPRPGGAQSASPARETTPAEAPAPTASATNGTTQDTTAKAAALKNLIDAWDQRQLKQARSLLDLVPTTGAAAPSR